MKKKLTILLASETSAGTRVIQKLTQQGHEIVGLITNDDTASLSSPARYAEKRGISLYPADTAKDPAFAKTIRQSEVDILISIRFPYHLKQEIIAAAKTGSFNLHTGPLPQYGGRNAVCWAIYNGETCHGVTLHHLTEKIDSGPIAAQHLFSIDPLDSGLSLTHKCILHGIDLIAHLTDEISLGRDIPHLSQDQSNATYYGRTLPQQGWMNWHLPACRIVNFVRACDFYPFPSPWPNPQSRLNGHIVSICKARLTKVPSLEEPGTIRITADNQVLAATVDEWVKIELLRFDNSYVDPLSLLHNGDKLS